ncbi:transposable element Tcb1 transposase [Trichonephila clavipes]|nr:transposable element Tcb1 transposase [Trichonephila clavipes]
MSSRKQRSDFYQVSKFDRGRTVAYRDCGLSFREIGSRVGRNQTNAMRICDRWMQEGICLQHHDVRIRVWRHRGHRMLNSCVLHRHTEPAPVIMVWGDIGNHSRTPLVRSAGTLNSQRYIYEVLEPVVLPYLQGFVTAIFQQDNARSHVSRIVQKFFVNDHIELLPWPARSPDLSLI